MYGGDSRHQLQAENLLMEQQRQNVLIGAGAPASIALSNANAFSSANRSSGTTLQFEGNQSIFNQSGQSLEGRIASPADLLSGDVGLRSSSALASEPKEEAKVARLPARENADEDDEDGDVSDQDEDALDDEAFYRKRNSVETVEDLRLQNETFPVKLYRMLYEVEKNGKADIVSFLPHGRSFAIHKQNEFATILPGYFATDRMASFQRQLNLYGFRRITDGKDKGAFFHEKFTLGKRSLCKKIKRKRGNRRSSSSLRRGSQASSSSTSMASQQGQHQHGS
ncbi:shock factor protein (Partial), partial [Seminavis robusta]